MSQRHFLRSASRAFSECQASLRAAVSSKQSNASVFSQSVIGKAKGSAGQMSSLAPIRLLRSLQSECIPVSAVPSALSMGFAASASSVSGPLMGAAVENLVASTTGTTLEGDGEDEEPTYLRPVAGSQTSLTSASSPEDEPPDLQGLSSRGLFSHGSKGTRSRPAMSNSRGDDGGNEAELVAAARDIFTSQSESVRGPLPSLPREVREALYGHRWDRVLVDIRRSVERRPLPGGKEEVYTAMVATGNMAGIFGLGLGVAETAQLAIARAHLESFSRLTAVPLYRGHTIYHRLENSYHRMQILLMPRPEGWGLRCSDLLYELCNVVGIRNASIALRGRVVNKFYVAQCFQEALMKQTTPHDGVEATGMYVREVYSRKELPFGLKRAMGAL